MHQGLQMLHGHVEALTQLACICSAIAHRGADLGPTCQPAGKHGQCLHHFLYAQTVETGVLVPVVYSH